MLLSVSSLTSLSFLPCCHRITTFQSSYATFSEVQRSCNNSLVRCCSGSTHEICHLPQINLSIQIFSFLLISISLLLQFIQSVLLTFNNRTLIMKELFFNDATQLGSWESCGCGTGANAYTGGKITFLFCSRYGRTAALSLRTMVSHCF